MKKLILANALQGLGITPSRGLPMTHGQICLANDSLMGQASYTEEITSFAIGYGGRGNMLTELLGYLAPERPGGRDARVVAYDEHEPFETVDYKKVKRAILADFAEVKQRTATKNTVTLDNIGLTVRIDRDQIKDKPNWQQMHAAWLTDLVNRASIIQALALMTAAAATDTWTWNNTAQPDMDVATARVTLANATGFPPSRALYGDAASLKRQGAYVSQQNAGAFSARFSDGDIATATGLSQVKTNAERYNTTANAKQEFLGQKVLLFSAVDAESPEDPSNLVRHVAPASYGSGNLAVYITEEGVKTIYITVEKYEYLNVQHTTGLLLASIQ